jgi:hypothetical protein
LRTEVSLKGAKKEKEKEKEKRRVMLSLFTRKQDKLLK